MSRLSDDPQRPRVYAFEREVLRSPTTAAPLFPDAIPIRLSARAAALKKHLGRDLIAEVWTTERTSYGQPNRRAPTLRFSRLHLAARRHRSAGYYTPLGHIIAINALCATFGCLLHEITHSLTVAAREDHGPEFLGALIGVYRRHGGLERPLPELLQEAARRELRVNADWVEGSA